MKVTLLVCDRCGDEMREDKVEQGKLDLTVKFDDPEAGTLLPFRRRESLELCPECREAFADWLGERGELLAGLRTGSANGDAARTLEAEVPAEER